MGLDMYLTAVEYVSKIEFTEDEMVDNPKFEAIAKAAEIKPRTNFACIAVEYSIAYWRKANAIHHWFIENCGHGIDECQEIPVSLLDLRELRDVCKIVLDDKSKAQELLPPTSGFFFGSTEIDKYYWEDISSTYKVLTDILEEYPEPTSDVRFNYQASW